MDVLDIGCNTGYITVQAALSYNAKSVTGIDIDEDLLNRARSHLSFRYSRLYQPDPATQNKTPTASPPIEHDRINFFPISSIQAYGHLPFPRQRVRHMASGGETELVHSHNTHSSHLKNDIAELPLDKGTDACTLTFPHNVTFLLEDWGALKFEEAYKDEARIQEHTHRYDVILALSVIKWLHLEHGDKGLHNLFDHCFKALRPGGFLVIELQPWESYQKAVRKDKAPNLKSNLLNLRVKPEEFDDILCRLGLCLVNSYTGLPREIRFYRKEV
ncbi:Bicoid-interacting protein 3-domain-containing protein [Kalaharituber pfeilii]|nr:Bicoid-interacting protein 3-domain-containing protein [Kalaharituber pfeilii]